MEKEIQIITDEHTNDLIMLENGCQVLESFAEAWITSESGQDHIQIENPFNEGEVVDFGDGTTFPLAIEGLVQGTANQLIAEGYKDIVMRIFKRHGMITNLEEDNGEE